MQFFSVNAEESTEPYVRPPAVVNDVNMHMEISTPWPENVDSLLRRQKREKRNDDLAANMMFYIRRCTRLCTSNQAGGREVDYDDPSSTLDNDIDCYVLAQSDAQKAASSCEVVLLVHTILSRIL